MGHPENSTASILNPPPPCVAVKSMVGNIFFSRNRSLLDTVRFYQVTRMISDKSVVVRELHQMNTYHADKTYCSPISGRFISEDIVVSFCNNQILNNNTVVGSQLEYCNILIAPGITIKIWEFIVHQNDH